MNKATFYEFEDRKFPIPIGYETYLSNLYGDYMVIPKGTEEAGYSHMDHWEVQINNQ